MKLTTRFQRVLGTSLLTASLLAGGMTAAPVQAASHSSSIATQAAPATISLVAATPPAKFVGKIAAPAIVGVGLCGARTTQVHVMAFIFGFCAGSAFLTTPIGKKMMNSIVNGACRIPWIVRAATWGKYSRC